MQEGCRDSAIFADSNGVPQDHTEWARLYVPACRRLPGARPGAVQPRADAPARQRGPAGPHRVGPIVPACRRLPGARPGAVHTRFKYDAGTAYPQDDTEAARWHQLAADQGLAQAQFNLGGMYHKGTEVPQDLTKAACLFKLASDHGHQPARDVCPWSARRVVPCRRPGPASGPHRRRPPQRQARDGRHADQAARCRPRSRCGATARPRACRSPGLTCNIFSAVAPHDGHDGDSRVAGQDTRCPKHTPHYVNVNITSNLQ